MSDFSGQKQLSRNIKEISDLLVENSGPEKRSPWLRGVLLLLGLYLLLSLFVGWFWSAEPEPFNVQDAVVQHAGKEVVGTATTSALIEAVKTLLDKRGGYLSNDVMPPGLWLDNLPSWEYGVLIQVRDMSKAMREAFSRSRSQSTEDSGLALAESRFNFDHNSWAVPASESEYRSGVKYLGQYLERLTDSDEYNAQFFARADNLRYWLSTVETRLGSLSQRLSASVGQRRINTDLSGEEASQQATPAPPEVKVQTPWLEIDNVFYEARGSTWALMHFLRAVELDFADVLEKKNARVSLQQIIRELEASQQTVYSPMVLNGGGFGFLANHSLVMASYISRANAAIIDLRELLSRG